MIFGNTSSIFIKIGLLDMLGRNLRAVLYYARTGWRLKRVKDIVRAHPDLRTVGGTALGVISAFMNIDIKPNEQMEDVDMISAIVTLKEVL